MELEYNSQGRLHRYRDTDSGFAWRTHVYDDRGNTAANGVFAFHYDRSEQPVAISGPVGGGYAYDAHRRRVMQVHNGDVIYTLYALDGTLLYRDNATTGETTDYIAMGGHSVGRFDETGTFTWTHGDHLGSASAATNATGAILWTESYTPFGEVLQDPLGNRDEAGFTGHIRDAATGLTYAQARFYDPVIARFYAPDPVGFAGGGPGYFNRYAYTMNDPVNLVDPTGEWWLRAAKFIAGQIRRTRDFQRRYKEEVQGLPVQPAPVVISEMGERGGSAGAPPLPGGIVGEGSQQGGGRINSGPLLPEYGGTGNAQEDFETLTGGVPGAAPPTAPEGTRAGENGIQIRPGRPAEEGRPATGPRIDIPASGDKPRETLHYPPEEAQETEDAG